VARRYAYDRGLTQCLVKFAAVRHMLHATTVLQKFAAATTITDQATIKCNKMLNTDLLSKVKQAL
jgi:hypothetical protein